MPEAPRLRCRERADGASSGRLTLPPAAEVWYRAWKSSMFHFTNKDGHDAVASQPDWVFEASQPPPPEHPFGAYFTTLLPSTIKLASRLRIPRAKITYFFEFMDDGKLRPLPGGRGAYVFYSPTDYTVERPRQLDHGPSSKKGGVAS